LTTTPLNLVSGLAEVLFKGGAVLVIEGPAEFTPETEDSVILKRGRLTARMPETARPFTVNTPAARVLDHGTEFGVDVGAGGTTVEVFHGRVSLKPGTAGDRGAEPVAVLAGTASRVGPSGRSTAPARPGSVAFIRQEEFEARLEERQRAPKSRWLAFSHQFRRDPDLVAYYPFDNAGEARDQLINRAAATRGTLDGKLPRTAAGNGPMWAAGRWPGTTSLQFNGEGQAVVIPYDPALDVGDALTIAAWVQNDAPQSHSPIVSRWPGAKGEGGGAYQMIVVGDAGLCPNALQLWIGLEPNLRLQFSPGPTERTTSWQFLAATFDARTKTKVFYSNGRCLGRVIGSRDMAAGAGHLYIGAEAPVTTSNTFFTGRITELCILKRAMSADELRQMYEAGKPD